tara:strand:- start:374 stop:628 length:255 start_codon:yes stop_codon:yes gene_type:complete
MNHAEMIKLKETEISELENALERMNAKVTPETALTVQVANDVFGGTLRELKGQLFDIKVEKEKADASNELTRIMHEIGDQQNAD